MRTAAVDDGSGDRLGDRDGVVVDGIRVGSWFRFRHLVFFEGGSQREIAGNGYRQRIGCLTAAPLREVVTTRCRCRQRGCCAMFVCVTTSDGPPLDITRYGYNVGLYRENGRYSYSLSGILKVYLLSPAISDTSSLFAFKDVSS